MSPDLSREYASTPAADLPAAVLEADLQSTWGPQLGAWLPLTPAQRPVIEVWSVPGVPLSVRADAAARSVRSWWESWRIQ